MEDRERSSVACREDGTGATGGAGSPGRPADPWRGRPGPPSPEEGRLALGEWGERLAERHLSATGLVVVDRNWRVREGELDLVVWDGDADTWVAVEVKTRRGSRFGSPVEAITAVKAARLRRLARAWLQRRRTEVLDLFLVEPRAGCDPECPGPCVAVHEGIGDPARHRSWSVDRASRCARLRIDVVGIELTGAEPALTHLRAVA